MTLKWKSKKQIEDIPEFSSPFFKGVLQDLTKVSPRKLVEKREKWCNGCNNAETSIRGIKKLSQEKNKNYCLFITQIIKEKNLKKFTIKNILKELDPERNLTDGSLQRRALSILAALGYLKKEILEIKDKRENIKVRYLFSLNEIPIIPPCYDSKLDMHSESWKEYRETRYFSEQYEKEEK